MRIAILGGAGAMGGIFGGYLARSGYDVTLIDVARPAIEAINVDGLTIQEKDGSATNVRIPATDDPAGVGTVDLIVNFVKCYHTEVAVTSALPMLGADTAILSLQNGWGNVDRIAAVAGRDRVLVGLTYHGGTLLGPGRVKHPGTGMTFLGELSGEVTPRLRAVSAALQSSGFETTLSTRILDEVWKKLALNCLHACRRRRLLRFFAHELVAYPNRAKTRDGCDPGARLSTSPTAQGIALDYDERWKAITSDCSRRPIGGKASMLQDVEANPPDRD